MSMTTISPSLGTITMRIDPHVCYALIDGADQIELLRATSNAALDMIALTGIGSIKSFDAIQRDYDKLILLEKAGILSAPDSIRLTLHRELRTRSTILPGFTATSSDGLTITALFPAETTTISIETILQHLGIDGTDGSTKTPAGVICALINAANGIAVAHPTTAGHIVLVNALITAGQLHAIDRAVDGIDGICVLGGSGATDIESIGAGFSEVTLTSPTFEALRELVLAHNHTAIRFISTPVRRWALHQLLQATTEAHIIQISEAKPADTAAHIAALANIGGGVLLVGCEHGVVSGVKSKDKALSAILKAAESITPIPDLTTEAVAYDQATIIRVAVRGDTPPYITADGRVLVRRDLQTSVATPADLRLLCQPSRNDGADLDLPRSGVSIVSTQRRGGIWHYEVRDLRTTAGVTRDRAQGLWDYAIERHETLRDGSANLDEIKWHGQIGLWRAYIQGGRPKYDLVHRDSMGVIDHIFYGVSDWGLGNQWQHLIQTYAPQLAVDTVTFDEEAGTPAPAATSTPVASQSTPSISTPTAHFPAFQGERRPRWRGRGAITRIWRDESQTPFFDLLLKTKADSTEDGSEIQEYHGVSRDQLNQAWLDLINVSKPRTGIEVVETVQDDQGDKRFIFRNLRNEEVSPHPWRMNDIEEGSIRQYAARMHLADQSFDEESIRWWGNIGYMRPMRRQVDLVYRDENGVDHIFYAARRDELIGEWHDLLAEYDDVVE
jgi:hypothetical protein